MTAATARSERSNGGVTAVTARSRHRNRGGAAALFEGAGGERETAEVFGLRDGLDQGAVDRSFAERDILTNCRAHPRDEAPEAYKDFDEVLASVRETGLAREAARLEARFVIKDASKADD